MPRGKEAEPELESSIGRDETPQFSKIFGRGAFGAAKILLFGPFSRIFGEGRKSLTPPPLLNAIGGGRPLPEFRLWGVGTTAKRDLLKKLQDLTKDIFRGNEENL